MNYLVSMFIIGNIPTQYKKSTSAPLIKLVSTINKKNARVHN